MVAQRISPDFGDGRTRDVPATTRLDTRSTSKVIGTRADAVARLLAIGIFTVLILAFMVAA